MLNILPGKTIRRGCAFFLALCVCLGVSAALADLSPVMPAPSDAPVYWRLTSIEQTPEVRATNGYTIEYDIAGLDVDLGDGLLTESLLAAEGASQGMTLIASKNDETLMEHAYTWTPLPIYLEPGVTYAIDIAGEPAVGGGTGTTPNSLLGVYIQGELVARISAGNYTSHAAEASFEVSADMGVYRDGSLVVSIILRDVNDMFRDRIAYTYTMEQGVKPVPTPVPGFAPVEIASDAEVPEYYVPVEGKDGLWRIVTTPDQYRAYGSMSGSDADFFPADAEGNVVMDEQPANHADDFETHVKGFSAEAPEEVPEYFTQVDETTYSFTTRDGEEILRTYGRVDGGAPGFYAMDETGAVEEDAAAVSPEADFAEYIEGFGAAEPSEEEQVSFYKKVKDGIYTFTSREGETFLRAYGRLNGANPAYYEAEADGTVKEDAKAADPQADFRDYVEGFDLAAAPALPEHYEQVEENLYAVVDQNGERVYRVYGVKDGMEPAFYPASEEGVIEEDAQPVDPQADFEAYVAGFEPSPTPGLEVPDYYKPTDVEGVWSFEDKSGETHYRTYGNLNRGEGAFYPSDATGNVATDALPVEPASDLTLMPTPFTPMIPGEDIIPPFYLPVEATSLYSFVDMEGNTVYRVYGAYGSSTPQFYPADADGNPIEDADPIDPQEDYETYFGSFAAEDPEDAPPHYTPVEGKVGLFSYTNKQHETVYRVYGKGSAGEAAYFPADAEGRIVSGAQIDPEADANDTPTPLTNAVVTQTPPDPTATALVRDPGTPEPVQAAEPTPFTATVASQSMTPADRVETLETDVSAPPPAETSEEPTEEPVATEAAITEAPTEDVTEAPTEEPVVEEKSGGVPTWVIIAGVVVILIIGGVIYFVSRNKKKSDS